MNVQEYIKIALFLFLFLVVPAGAQDVVKCKLQDKPAVSVKYFVGHTESVAARDGDPKGLAVNIAIKSEQFRRDYLILLALNLKNRFCKEEILFVNIFDNKGTAASGSGLIFRSQEARNALRGAYILNRRTGEEDISFVSIPDFYGNPEARIQISLPVSH